MKILSFIENQQVIEKILKHLGLWEKKARPPPKTNTHPKCIETYIDYSENQLPPSDDDLCVDVEYPEAFPA